MVIVYIFTSVLVLFMYYKASEPESQALLCVDSSVVESVSSPQCSNPSSSCQKQVGLESKSTYEHLKSKSESKSKSPKLVRNRKT